MFAWLKTQHTYRRLFALVVGISLGFVPPWFVQSKPASVATTPPSFADTLVASVASPTAVAFTPDGRLLVATAPGTFFGNGADLGGSIRNDSVDGDAALRNTTSPSA